MSDFLPLIVAVAVLALFGWFWVRPGGWRERARARAAADTAWVRQVLPFVQRLVPEARGSGRELEIPIDGVEVTARSSGPDGSKMDMLVSLPKVETVVRVSFDMTYDDAGVLLDPDGRVPDDPVLVAAIERIRQLGALHLGYRLRLFFADDVPLGRDPARVIVECARACVEGVTSVRRIELAEPAHRP